MSGRKRLAETDSGSSSDYPTKKRKVTINTVQKWKTENDKALNTSIWLIYDKLDRDHVEALKCSVCIRFKDKLHGCRNYNKAFVEGSRNLRASSFKDHAATDMHKRAMILFHKSRSTDITEYSAIAKALSTIDPDTECKLKRKFEIAYMICREGLAFTKMAALCELEEKHGVDLGTGYKNNQACSVFVDYIAQAQREGLAAVLAKAKFCSIQADSSTDSGNVEDELFLVVYFDPYTQDGKVHVKNKFLTVRQPARSNAEGLYECFVRALTYAGIVDWENKLVGFGCDGASVNLGAHGLRGYLEKSVPWVLVFWCLSHRLELALKDALRGTLFSSIDEMLLRAYLLYEKSPKKCHDLDEIVECLRQYLLPAEMPKEGGNRPIRACGSRFICHKVAAIGRFIDRYGAYISHLIALTEDSSVKAVDRQKLKGYVLKWRDSKIVFGCALFYDILKPAATLCKALQDDEICIVTAIEGVLKTNKAIEHLKSITFEDLPTVKKVLDRIQQSKEETTYQGATLTCYKEGVSFLKSHKNEYVERVVTCLKERVKSQHCDILTHTIVLLATQGWEKPERVGLMEAALKCLISHFKVPLERSGADISLVREEWDDMTDYAKQYFSLVREDYRTIWWKLFNAANAKKWGNILTLIELLFSFPVTNGHLERVFSTLKLIKTNRRSSLGEDKLDHLIRIAVDGPPFNQWDATDAVHLWWKSKQRRQVQDSRAAPTCSTKPSCEDTETEIYSLNIDDWDTFVA